MIDHLLAFLAGGMLAWVLGYTLGVWLYEQMVHGREVVRAMTNIDDEIRNLLSER